LTATEQGNSAPLHGSTEPDAPPCGQDTPDNRILECPLAAGADLIVTGDRHLVKLKKYGGIAIIRLAGSDTDVSRRAGLEASHAD
jgi:hypothetical protein